MRAIIFIETTQSNAEGLKNWYKFFIHVLSTTRCRYQVRSEKVEQHCRIILFFNDCIPLSPRFLVESLPIFVVKSYAIIHNFDNYDLLVFKDNVYLQCLHNDDAPAMVVRKYIKDERQANILTDFFKL